VEEVEECAYMVAPRVVRTEKFLSAMSLCKTIVTKDWLDESIKQSKLMGNRQIFPILLIWPQYFFVDPVKYFLHDKESEDKYHFKLGMSLQRAKKKKLFQGKVVVCTPNIKPDPTTLQRIVESAGGRVQLTHLLFGPTLILLIAFSFYIK
jgi:PAX-interacting protein 1